MLTFGERIYELRNKNNMSQGDLAAKLDVARQTISKWENNICMPETEKLVQISGIFGVSIDYILKGEEKQNEPTYIYVKDGGQDSLNTNEQLVRKYVGIVLAIVFSIITIVLLIMGGSILAIIPGTVAVLGIFLAKNVKHPWLLTGWITYIVAVIALPFFTIFSLFLIFDPVIYTEGYIVHLVGGYGLWLVLVILIISTIKVKKRKGKQL